MKIIIALALVFILVQPTALGALLPWPAYCEHQGYTYDHRNSECIFDDGFRCAGLDFYANEDASIASGRDKCGQDYVKEIGCRQEGEVVYRQFEKCCVGFTPESGVIGQPDCVKSGFYILVKMWGWIVGLFV